MTSVVKKGYAIGVKNINNELIFVVHIRGSDGGYPTFSEKLDPKNVKSSIYSALEYIKKYKSDLDNMINTVTHIKPNSIQVFDYSQVFEEVDADDIEEAKVKHILGKLSIAEIKLLKKKLK